MSETGKYIYAIINSNNSLRFYCPSDFSQGTGSNTVYTISHEDISAVVNDREVADYNYMQRDALARLLVGHQMVIERIMNAEVVALPVRLGTFAADEDEVKEILKKGYRLIKDVIELAAGKIEIDICVTYRDFDSILKEAGEEKEVKEVKERLLSNQGTVTVEEQIKVGAMVKNVLDEKKRGVVFKMLDVLRAVCNDYRQHEVMDDKMAANIAFLINRNRQEEFYAAVEEMNNEFAGKLDFRCVGPLPPYSFYTIEIKKMRHEEVDWARKKLGLQGDFVTKDEIKKAHQTATFALHPDRNPGAVGIEKEFNEAARAYKTLQEYCQGEGCSFDEEEFKKNSILVRVKG